MKLDKSNFTKIFTYNMKNVRFRTDRGLFGYNEKAQKVIDKYYETYNLIPYYSKPGVQDYDIKFKISASSNEL